MLGNHHFKFGLEKVWVRGGRNEIHAEVSSRRRADPGDFGSDEVGRLTHHAKETKATGRAYGGHKFGSCDATHPGQNHRDIAAE
jgi:hypothetical protein